MEQSVLLRPANANDLPFLVSAEKAVFSDAWSETAIVSHLASNCTVTVVAEENGIPLGYLFGSLIPPEGEVLRIAVLPAFRGKGVGEKILLSFLTETPVCFLEVREDNLPARRLYEKCGFLLMGKRKNYYKNPAMDAYLYRYGKERPS